MKTTTVTLLLLLVFPAFGLAGPILEMPSRSITLEQSVFEGQEARAVFPVRNSGDSDLIITNVVSGCGCATSFFDRSISPGCEGRIEITINTSGLEGIVRKRALVKTNDPRKAAFMIELEVMVMPRRN